ncbi:efflux RND transporter periplasmic adaptor subunit [Candidatus Microgenomates bacterium]|nr:efflux RND transporter periplasmic adaptor subunit [Candidatus Microgenomates bacterium]
MNKRSAIIALILIAVISGSVWGWKNFFGKKEPAFKTIKVERGSIEQTVSASGRVKAKKEVDLRFRDPGKLAWVGIEEGQQVFAGQQIAQLDQREMRANLDKSLLDYLSERNDFDELTKTTYPGQTPQTAANDTVKRILEKEQWDLNKSILDVELKNISLEYSTLVSPIGGIVTKATFPVAGLNILTSEPAFTIADPSSTIFLVNVDEADIGSIKEGQEVLISLDAYFGQNFNGQVKKIAFSSVSTSGGGTAFPIEVNLPENSGQRFKIGMNGDAEITIAQKDNVLTIPIEALKEKDGKKFIRVLKDGTPEEIEVETGIASETKVEITRGVGEGEVIIVGE